MLETKVLVSGARGTMVSLVGTVYLLRGITALYKRGELSAPSPLHDSAGTGVEYDGRWSLGKATRSPAGRASKDNKPYVSALGRQRIWEALGRKKPVHMIPVALAG